MNHPMFALGIFLEETEGRKEKLRIETDNRGLHDEAILTMMRNWLRKADDQFHDKFKAESA